MIARWTTRPLVFLDLETSGANLASDRIIEIGLVEVDAECAREWSVLVNPERALTPFITRLTGIDDAMLSSAPTFGQLADELLSRLRGRLLIAHNARFDYGFLRCEFGRLGIEFRSATLCTVKLSRRLFPEHHQHNLDTLVARHRLQTAGDRHRALADARLICELWHCWHEQLSAATVGDAVAFLLGQPILPPQLPPTILDDLPDTAGAYTFLAAGDRPLLVRRSTNVRRDVLAQLANADGDAPLLRDTLRIEWREAAGDFGARLRERQLTTEGAAASRSDRLAGSRRDLCAWQILPASQGDFRPQLVFADDLDFASADHLFGLYATPAEAKRALRRLAEAQQLCSQQLGLEEGPAQQACSAYRLQHCRGACIGKESAAAHGLRFLAAMTKYKLRRWPYPGPVAVLESDPFGLRQDLHVIDRWRHIATVHTEEALDALLAQGLGSPPPFDADLYRLLSRGLQQGKWRLRQLPIAALS